EQNAYALLKQLKQLMLQDVPVFYVHQNFPEGTKQYRLDRDTFDDKIADYLMSFSIPTTEWVDISIWDMHFYPVKEDDGSRKYNIKDRFALKRPFPSHLEGDDGLPIFYEEGSAFTITCFSTGHNNYNIVFDQDNIPGRSHLYYVVSESVIGL